MATATNLLVVVLLVLFQISVVLSVYGDQATPASSCADILRKRTDLPSQGIFYILLRGSNTPVLCDFTIFPGKAATLIYKVTAGIGGFPYSMWTQNSAIGETDSSLLTMYASSAHYKSSYQVQDWLSIRQISVQLRKNGALQQYVTVNATGSNTLSFFRGGNVISSSWTDIPTVSLPDSTSGRYFTPYGKDGPISWYINSEEGGCTSHRGWMKLMSDTETCESSQYGSVASKIAIAYAPGPTQRLHREYAFADVMAVWADIDIPASVGDSAMNPGLSCTHIMSRRGNLPTGRYYVMVRGVATQVMCNFNIFSGRAATLVYKINNGVDGDPYAIWVAGGGLNEKNPDLLTLQTTTAHYSSSLLRDWGSIKQVALYLYNIGEEKRYLYFNTTGRPTKSWFAPENVIKSSWTDLPTSTSNAAGDFFTIRGSDTSRQFYMNKDWSGCVGDRGWLLVQTGVPNSYSCWETYFVTPNTAPVRIGYSSQNTVATVSSFLLADVMAIWADITETGEVPAKPLGEDPEKPALSCQHIYRKRGALPTGVYYISTTSGVIPVMCNFQIFPNRGATLLYKITSGLAADPYKLWSDQTAVNDNDVAALSTTFFPYRNYVSRFVGNWSKISQVSVRTHIYSSDKSYINFNVTGQSYLGWFDKSNVIGSSWPDLVGGNAIFTMAGSIANTAFTVDKTSGTSCTNMGYMMVANGTIPCTNFGTPAGYQRNPRDGVVRVGISSSASNVYYSSSNIMFSDVLTIWGDISAPDGSDSPLLGETPSNPAISCNSILRERGPLDAGIFYVGVVGGTVQPVMCDFTIFPRRAATLLYKLSSGVPGGPIELWNTPANPTTSLDALNTWGTKTHFASQLISTSWYRASQASVRVYKGGLTQKHVNFKVQLGQDKMTGWFNYGQYVSSSWTDLPAKVNNSLLDGSYFTIQSDLVGRYWYINRNFGGCPLDAGWMLVTNMTDVCETIFLPPPEKLVIMYSPYSSISMMSATHFADAFAVWADIDLEYNLAKLGETPQTAALSCDQIIRSNGTATTGVYFVLVDGKAVPTLCNFEVFPGRGATMLAKFSALVDMDVYDLWANGKVTNDISLLTTARSLNHYISPYAAAWSKSNIPKISVHLYTKELSQKYINFNGTGSTSTNWYGLVTVTNSSWTDIVGSSTLPSEFTFGPKDLSHNTRQWPIAKGASGCSGDAWLTLFVNGIDPCADSLAPLVNRFSSSRVTIAYSHASTSTPLSGNTASFAYADSMVIWGLVDTGAPFCSQTTCEQDQVCLEVRGGCVPICDFYASVSKPPGTCSSNAMAYLSLTVGDFIVKYHLDKGAWTSVFFKTDDIPFNLTAGVPYVVEAENELGCIQRINVNIPKATVPKIMPSPKISVDTASKSINVLWNNALYPAETGRVALTSYTLQYRSTCGATTSAWTNQTFTPANTQASVSYVYGATYDFAIYGANCRGDGNASGITTVRGLDNPSKLFLALSPSTSLPTSGGSLVLQAKNTKSGTQVWIDGALRGDCTINDVAATITCPVGPGAGLHNVTVTSPDSACSSQTSSLIWSYTAPNVTSATQLSGLGGNMTIKGTNFGVIGTTTIVTIDNTTCSNCSVVENHSSIFCEKCAGGQGVGHNLVVTTQNIPSLAFEVKYPVCDPVCVFGECVADGVCKCNDGYGSQDCSQEQFCAPPPITMSSCGSCATGLCCNFVPIVRS